MRRFLRRRLVCREAVELMTAYVEGTLDAAERARFEGHLAGCPHCTEYLAQMRRTIELSGHLRDDDVPSDVIDVLTQAFAEYHHEGGR